VKKAIEIVNKFEMVPPSGAAATDKGNKGVEPKMTPGMSRVVPGAANPGGYSGSQTDT